MKNSIILFFTILCWGFNTNAQTIISGRVLSVIDGEPVPFATVKVLYSCYVVRGNLITGDVTNEDGYFKVKIDAFYNADSFQLVLDKFGYETTTIPIVVSCLDTINRDFIIGKAFKEEEYLFSAKDAERDIENGVVQFYFYGFPAIPPDTMSKIIEKNGLNYKINYLGCEVNQNIVESVKQYNSYVDKYMEEQYGKNWAEGIKKEVDIYLENNKEK